jgi:mannose-6-phosphate isomerase-like protein (cupin superfamily)
MSRFIRPIDWTTGSDAGLGGGYRGVILYPGESCYVIATKVPPRAHGPARHTHASDQIYVVIDGEITLELGTEPHTIGKYGVGFIPAGRPHFNHNDTDADEIHIEVIAPGGFLQPIASPTDSTDATGRRYYTRQSQPTTGSGMATSWLANRESGSRHASIYLAEMAPGASGPPTHIHDFDQFYFVLEGSLEVEVALEEHVVGPNTLVVLPAGVPHSQRNASSTEVERHLAILAAEPELPHSEEHPWDTVVELTATGEHVR